MNFFQSEMEKRAHGYIPITMCSQLQLSPQVSASVMVSSLLLGAAISVDGLVHDVPYTLLSVVAAVERVNEGFPQSAETEDIIAVYQAESVVHPLERLLLTADDFSLHRIAKKDELGKITGSNQSIDAPNWIKQVETDLLRLLSSTSRLETKDRLGREIERLRKARSLALMSFPLPNHLRIATIEEDPLEFRRDTHGVALPCGKWLNVLGERYAGHDVPLSFIHKHSAPEIFKRMKRVVRADLSTRNQRRIAAINAKERQRLKDLELQGILSPEQQLEAKLDRLFAGTAAT